MSHNAMAATRATSGSTVCGATVNASPLSTQQQDIDDSMTNSNTTRTIDAYPTTNGTPMRYECCKIYLNKLHRIIVKPSYILSIS